MLAAQLKLHRLLMMIARIVFEAFAAEQCSQRIYNFIWLLMMIARSSRETFAAEQLMVVTRSACNALAARRALQCTFARC